MKKSEHKIERPPRYKELLDTFRGFQKQSAEGMVRMGETIVTAQFELGETLFKEYCKEVGLKKKSTISKWLAIGGKVSHFANYFDRLPNSWTTLYEQSRCPPHEFDEGIKSGRIHPEMTAKDLRLQAPSRPKKIMLRIDITHLNESEQVEAYSQIRGVCEPLNLVVDAPQNLILPIEERSTPASAERVAA